MPLDANAPSPAEALYGRDGPIDGGPSDPRVRAQIEGGVAKPSNSLLTGEQPPARGGDAAARAPSQQRPPPLVPLAVDKLELGEGMTADPQLMGEFAKEIKELGVGHMGAQRLMDLHVAAIKKGEQRLAQQAEGWGKQLAQEIPERDLAAVRDLINDVALTPAPIREWLARPEVGNNPDLVRTLVNWSRAIGRRRY